MVYNNIFERFKSEMISAFQNCAKFEDWTYFGKTHYPKENIIMLSYSVSDKLLRNQKWATLQNAPLVSFAADVSKEYHRYAIS